MNEQSPPAITEANACPFSKAELEAELERLAPYLLKVDLPYGLTTPSTTQRLQGLKAHSWSAFLEECGGSLKGRRVLDIACVNGGFSIEAAAAGAEEVIGIDVVPHYIEQATFLKTALGLSNVHFECMDLNDLTPETFGMFDTVLCFGIVYHLENPIASMRQICSLTNDVLFVDTNILPGVKHRFFRLNFQEAHDSDAATAKEAVMMWRKEKIAQMKPSKIVVEDMLEFFGFSKIQFVEPHEASMSRYVDGQTGSFIARR